MKLANLPQLKNEDFFHLVVDASGSACYDENYKQTVKSIFSDNIKCKVFESCLFHDYSFHFNSLEDLSKFKFSFFGGDGINNTLEQLTKEDTSIPVLVITDGHTDVLDLSPFDNATIITTKSLPRCINPDNVFLVML